jgi:hypothetical protein
MVGGHRRTSFDAMVDECLRYWASFDGWRHYLVVVGRAWWEKGEGKFLGERKREREREREK